MYFEQFYLGCLAHASYLIASEGEAAIVDPQRDVELYLAAAAKQNARIRFVIETHLHADFVSGHRELAARTGAEIVFGHRAGATFPHRAVHDGDELAVGRVTLRILETPGHTPESISILVLDSDVPGRPHSILTGDTLFIGDVGRPDLVGSKGYSPADMAGMLYDSLHEKLLRLPDEVAVYPAHGAGSMCGRNISKQTSSTLGEQRRFNYALQPMERDAFVRLMTTDLPAAPAYFARDAEINRTGATSLEEVPRPAALTPNAFDAMRLGGATVVDVRNAAAYGNAHVPGAVNLGLGGQFASWAGSLLTGDASIVLVTEDEAQVDEAVTRLARVGIESVRGYLDGGMLAWDRAKLPTARIQQMPVTELHARLREHDDLQVVDVRRLPEYAGGHVPGATSAPLAELEARLSNLNPRRPIALICASGYRSSVGTSLLERHGYETVFNVVGGTTAWVQAGFDVEPVPATSASG
jgi:glyoxylase-like metal-dependent hydrolase (beta-lactamase superfamily II)/rhodanese-related sulfurtransferase